MVSLCLCLCETGCRHFVAFIFMFGRFSLFPVVIQSNPVPGLCPCCKDPQSSDFLQSIHSDGLFNMVQKLANHFGHSKLGRKYLFCDKCIGWGKIEVIRLRELTQPAGPSQQPGQLQQQQQQQQPVVIFQPADHSQPHYSPVSDPEGSHSTPEPFNVQLYSQQSRIGARLANPNDSPIHLGADRNIVFPHVSD